jgi:hypothetical protein
MSFAEESYQCHSEASAEESHRYEIPSGLSLRGEDLHFRSG